ncbi:MAG: LysM peptidoglycan-binding domain-containing protein [Lentisphaerae bacterium]|nr:LysM peptidoglycan-binding domain-containing protein [Lentisphaerota bacterium]
MTIRNVTVRMVAAVLALAGAARAEEAADDLRTLAARQRQLAHALDLARTDAQRQVLRAELGPVNHTLLLDPRFAEGKTACVVQSGDSLARIAKRHGITVELLRAANGMTRDTVRAGQTLLVPAGTVSLHVDKSDNVLTVLRDGRFFREYRVATGRENRTPVGEFTITDRVEKPTWWRPADNKPIPYGDPEHELGTHWLAWSIRGFGIHGTNKPESIGTQASLGCVRMLNEEVVQLFALAPSGTKVVVQD